LTCHYYLLTRKTLEKLKKHRRLREGGGKKHLKKDRKKEHAIQEQQLRGKAEKGVYTLSGRRKEGKRLIS